MNPDRPALPYDWSEIRAQLQGNLWALLDRLALRDELTRHAQGDGQRIFPKNPTRDDRKAGSFVVWITGDGKGAWKDYATQEKGDVFDLVAYVLGLQAKIDVYWWALDFLRLDRRGSTRSPRTLAAVEAERQRRVREETAAAARQQADETRKSSGLFKLWLGLPSIAGTPAEHYLRAVRGIPLERLKHMPGALRWAASVDYVDPDGEVHEWRSVMVAAMTRGKRLAALHRTYLKPDGSGKAGVKPRLMIGPCKGAAIRLASGPSGLSPTKAADAGRRDPLAIGEGIETCLTIAAARPDYRVWAAGSLSLMDSFGWPTCASAVVLLGENDWSTPEAVKRFAAVEAHWRRLAEGRPVQVVHSAIGSDFNDWARGAA